MSFLNLNDFFFDFFFFSKAENFFFKSKQKKGFLSMGYTKSIFKSYFFKGIRQNKETSLFFSFLGSLSFEKISDFFSFKVNNSFDINFFFKNKNFDFIVFNHIFNRFFFFHVLNACYKMKKADFFFPVLNHYDFVHSCFPFVSSVTFFSRTNFIKVPSVYKNTEKELFLFLIFFEIFFISWNVF